MMFLMFSGLAWSKYRHCYICATDQLCHGIVNSFLWPSKTEPLITATNSWVILLLYALWCHNADCTPIKYNFQHSAMTGGNILKKRSHVLCSLTSLLESETWSKWISRQSGACISIWLWWLWYIRPSLIAILIVSHHHPHNFWRAASKWDHLVKSHMHLTENLLYNVILSVIQW